jgi:hypothetical protein
VRDPVHKADQRNGFEIVASGRRQGGGGHWRSILVIW